MTPPLGWGVLNQSKEHQVAREELIFAYLFPESHLFAYRSRDLLLKNAQYIRWTKPEQSVPYWVAPPIWYWKRITALCGRRAEVRG